MTSALVIGSGIIGTYVTTKLLEIDFDVTILEAGPPIPMADPAQWYNVVTGGTAPYTSCYDEAGDYQSSGVDPWQIQGGRVIGAGGSTLHWGGWTPRFKPEDFQLFTNTGQGIDWLYSYDDLEPYYSLAEDYLGVSGDSSNMNPPRSSNYPFKPAPYPLMMGLVIEAMESNGISYMHMPVSRYGQNVQNRNSCMTTGTCKYCPIGGRYTGDQTLNTLMNNPNVTILFNSPAIQILMSAKDTASGVEYLDIQTGTTKTLEADFVFVCAGALETPKLLLNSTQFWSNGIGNDNDLVGRFLMASPYFYASGTIDSNPDKLESELGFPSLCSRFYDTPEYQANGKFFFNADYANPHVDIAALMAQGKSVAEIQSTISGPMQYDLQGTMAAIPSYNNRVTSGTDQTRFGLPTTIIDTPDPLYDQGSANFYMNAMEDILTAMGCQNVTSGSYPQRGDHAMGTCRMADSPDEGVVGQDLQVFGVDNLFVMGHATFPSMGAANPSLTMLALTMLVMEYLTGEKLAQ